MDTERLLDELCAKLGFCLDPDDKTALIESPPATVDAFTGLERGADGRVRVELRDDASGTGLVLWADESYTHLQLFTGDPLPDVARRSLAVEPMTCPPNAFRSGEGVIRLEPGASWSGAWGIS